MPTTRQVDIFRQIVENGHVPMMVTGNDATIQYVNAEFCHLTGYAPEELVGQKPSLLKSGKTPDSVYQDMWQTLTQGQPWHGELINKRKNGDVYTELIYISPMKNDLGDSTGYVGVWVDISGQKIKEEEMRILSVTDPLAGLFNRRGFVTHAVQAMKVARREQTGFELLMIDIDGLKKINDQYGHICAETNTIMQKADGLLSFSQSRGCHYKTHRRCFARSLSRLRYPGPFGGR